jgi:hypothetical protein
MRIALVAMLLAFSVEALSQSAPFNFKSRKAIELNQSPYIELSNFLFFNEYDDRARRIRLKTHVSWKNISKSPIIAFEIVLVRYDAFNRHMSTRRWTVTGRDSGNWEPLQPDQIGGDAALGLGGAEDVFTQIAYVRQVRLEDGTIWQADPNKIAAAVKAAVPGGVREIGDLEGRRDPPAQH